MERSSSAEKDLHACQRTLQELRAAIRQNAGYQLESEIPGPDRQGGFSDVADLAHVSAHLPLSPTIPLFGRIEVFVKRVMRLGLRWYINPVVEQQNAFNDSVARALTDIELRQQDLARRLHELERKQTDS